MIFFIVTLCIPTIFTNPGYIRRFQGFIFQKKPTIRVYDLPGFALSIPNDKFAN
nr:hypothetical protein [Spirosoma aureum]